MFGGSEGPVLPRRHPARGRRGMGLRVDAHGHPKLGQCRDVLSSEAGSETRTPPAAVKSVMRRFESGRRLHFSSIYEVPQLTIAAAS